MKDLVSALAPATNHTGLITMTPAGTGTTVTLMIIGGTDGIIDIITTKFVS
jgi:hypothetical protein